MVFHCPIIATLGVLLLLGISNSEFLASRHFKPLPKAEEQEKVTGSMGPNLLFSKSIQSDVFAIGWEFGVTYQIINVGNFPAEKVRVRDPDFFGDKDAIKFKVVKPNSTGPVEDGDGGHTKVSSGEFGVKVLSPGENVTFSLMAIPLASEFPSEGDFYRFNPARISYSKGADAEVQIGWSSLNLERKVGFLPKLEADRLHMSKTKDILLLILFMLTVTVCPYVLWKKHSLKYDALQAIFDERKAARKTIRQTVTKAGKKFY